MENTKKERAPKEDKIFYASINALCILLIIIMIYPLIYIVSASFSSSDAIAAGKVILFPVDFSIEGYEIVFNYPDVAIGYRNTIFYTVVGTIIKVIMTLMCAYPLSRRNLPHKGVFMFIFTFTMLFNGGIIPNYLLMDDLNILNKVWVMLIPGAISVYSMIITRTFMQFNIPEELYESAKLDGCSDIVFFIKFAIPLSKAVIAVIAMQYAVAHWNSYFNAFIYLTSKKLFPLQIFLRQILVMSQINLEDFADPEQTAIAVGLAELMKYALIVVSTLPILCIYPFFQKYFTKGVMIGSLKG